VDIPAALAQTDAFYRLMAEGRFLENDWHDQKDHAFLNGMFEVNPDQPFFLGPDGLTYASFRVPAGKLQNMRPQDGLDLLIRWVAGAVVFGSNNEPACIYSPGDVVAMALDGKTRRLWEGRWNEPADAEAYRRGGMGWIGQPSAEVLPPLAARSLEFGLRGLFSRLEKLKGRLPGVILHRLAIHDKPEDPSDIGLNVFVDDVEGTGVTMQAVVDRASHFLPHRIGLRLVLMPCNEGAFLPLKTIVETAGLQLTSDR
jgi:hypothetical protein